MQKGVLRNFVKFTGKHMYQRLIFNKVAAATLLKKSHWHRCFPVNFEIFLKTPFCIEHLWCLLLSELNIRDVFWTLSKIWEDACLR